MDILKVSKIWDLPVFCAIAGIISFVLEVSLLSRFAIVETIAEDGTRTVTADPVKNILISALIFAAVLAAAGIGVARKLDRKSVFFSALIMAGYRLALTILGMVAPTGSLALTAATASLLTNWSTFVSQVLLRMDLPMGIISVFFCAVPFVFLLFTRKNAE